MKRRLKIVLLIVAVLLLLGSIVPYFIPLTSYKDFEPENLFPESRIEEVDGVELHYRIFFPEERPVGKILLVHGLGGSTFSWNSNMEYLRDAGYVVVAVDLPAFGYSSRKPEIDHSQKNRSKLLWLLLASIDEKQIQDKSDGWTLVGHSMGGGTVAAMAMAEAEKTKAVVFVDAALFSFNSRVAVWALAYPPLSRWAQVVLRYSILKKDRIESFLNSAYGRSPDEKEISGYLRPLEQPGTEGALLDFVKTSSSEAIDPLGEAEIPILAIWGENDNWVPLAEAEQIRNMIPGMELEVI
ncbi:MAG: alpha/beta hydrolase, partial [Eubacteriales bacterium]|nr:alpha/beta hydrolase [Eubacteriales bacterium]